jgi:sugar phosphate isomerase/epimerase
VAPISRREFLRQAAADAAIAAFVAGGAVQLRANPLGLPIGSQTWPHRAQLKDFPAFVKTMAGIGVTRLELCSPIGYGPEFASLSNGKEVRKILADHGMQSESSHFSLGELRGKQDQSLAWANDVGITQIITASLGDGNGGSKPTMDQVKKAADEYNRIAAITAKAGLQQGLHNEGFEASMVDGKRTYDLLFDLLDPKLVKFQFQMSEISNGFVAADYFTKYPGRFFSMHVQDVDLKAPAATGGPGGRGRGATQVAVGKGSIDWPKTFQAARVGGVKNYFVEQNMDLTKESVAALKAMNT